jgi:Tfp pilus assembly protein PilF
MQLQFRIFGPALAAILVLVPSAKAQQQNLDRCNNPGGKLSSEQQIGACTALIKSGRITGKNLAVVYRNRGFAYAKSDDIDNALTDLDEAIKIDPKDHAAYFLRAQAHWSRGYSDRAHRDLAYLDLNEAIRFNPKFFDAYLLRGEYFAEEQKEGPALVDFNEALKLNPFAARALRMRGHAYYRAGQYARASLDYGKAIAVEPNDPENPRLHESIGFLHFFLGNFDISADELAKGRQKPPAEPALRWAFDRVPIWAFVARARHEARDPGRTPITSRSELEQRVGQLAKDGMYLKLAEMFLGRLSPDAAFAAARNDVERCDGNFFIGQWHVLRHEREQAVERLKSVLERCGIGNPAWRAGEMDLKRLGASAAIPAKIPATTVPSSIPGAKAPPNIPSATGQPPAAADCALAETHWKSVEALGVLVGYEDHLARFPNCAFATLAKAKIEALKRK